MHSITNFLVIGLFFLCAFVCPAQNQLLLNEQKLATNLTASPEKESVKPTQSPYNLSLSREIGLFSTGFGLQIGGMILEKRLQPLTLAEIELLTTSSISKFDRTTVGNYSLKAQSTSDIFLYSSLMYPLLFTLDKQMRKDYLVIGSMASQALILNTGITTMVKGAAKRTRPFVYDPLVPIEKKTSRSARLSFFSGHTSTVSTMAFFSAKVFSDYHPDSKWKPVVWTAAALIPATTGYLRYKGGKHFPTDVIVGYGVGAAIGVLIPHLHRNKRHRQFQVSPMATSNAVGFSLRGTF